MKYEIIRKISLSPLNPVLKKRYHMINETCSESHKKISPVVPV